MARTLRTSTAVPVSAPRSGCAGIRSARPSICGASGRAPENRAELTDGEALVQAALIHARSFRQIAEARGLSGQEWERYFAKRLWECLNSLAVVYGFANADRIHKT
jgi:hypothetical protein